MSRDRVLHLVRVGIVAALGFVLIAVLAMTTHTPDITGAPQPYTAPTGRVPVQPPAVPRPLMPTEDQEAHAR